MTSDPHKPNGTHRIIHFWPVIAVGITALIGYGTLLQRVTASERVMDAVPKLESKVAVLENKAVDGNRITKLEAQMETLNASITRLQTTLDQQARRERRE